MSDKPEIDVQRRRKGEKPTRQVERPVRRDSSPTSTPSGGLTGGGVSGGIPGGSLLRSSGGKMGCGGILLVGFLVSDLDGNMTQAFLQVQVQ